MTLTPTRPAGPTIQPATEPRAGSPAASATDLTVGRHRRGRPGLIPVTEFVAVRYRSWLSHLFRPPRHRARRRRRIPVSS